MSRFDNYSFTRPFRNANRAVQIILALALVFALNFLASGHFERFDLTKSGKYSLSPETVAHLEALDEPVKVIIAMPLEEPDSQQIYEDLQRLLREFAYKSIRNGEAWLQVEFVDIYKDRFRAQEIQENYGVNEDAAMLVVSGDRNHRVDATKLYEYDARNNPTAFRGEQLFISAILEVASPDQDKLYFVIGHGEMGLRSVDARRGLTEAAQFLRKRGFAIEPLDLAEVPEIPDDADAVVLADPTGPLLEFEVEKLRRFMNERSGRMVALLSVGSDAGLQKLFADWGIYAADMGVADAAPGAVTPDGKILVRAFSPDHPITEFLAQAQLRVVGRLSRPVVPHPNAPADERLKVEPLMASSEQSWGEVSYRGSKIEFNENVDLQGPIPLAMVAQRQSGSRMNLNIPGGRLVVYGNSTFFANENFEQPGNRLLFSNTINWLVDRDNLLDLKTITPRKIESMRLALTNEDLNQLGQRFLLVPIGMAALGLIVFFVRRR